MTSSRPLVRLMAATALLVGLAPPASAITRHQSEFAAGGRSMLAPRPLATTSVDPDTSDAWAESDPAWQAFLEAHPGTWHPRFDTRSGRLSFAWGSGIDWLPRTARVTQVTERAKTLDVLEAQARAFIAANPGLYRIPAGVDLVRDDFRSGEIDDGRVWYLRFALRVNGVPVDGIAASFHLNSGRLVQFGVGAITDALAQAPTVPALGPDATALLARQAIAKALGLDPAGEAGSLDKARIEERDEARLFVLTMVSPDGRGFAHRLAWEQSFATDGIETWVLIHDAVTGERLAFFDDNRYACPLPASPQGRVVGGVYVGPIETSPEVIRPMQFAAVQNGTPKVADFNGIFPFTVGSPADTSLSGRYFNMDCNGCTSPAQAFAQSLSWGVLSLGVGGDDATGNGLSTKAERNCFYHLNNVRQLAAAQITDAQANGFFSRTTPANVNINNNCNAFWDGNSVNFFRAGGGCNNTGEIADVMQHEWGHGLDQFTGGGNDGARGEGLSDVVAFLSTHDPNLGPFFVQGNPAGIRNADELVAGLKTRTNLGGAGGCPSVGGGGDGPLGFEVHCEGELSSQVWWHLARNLRGKYGETAGWYATERLFFKHMPIAHWSVYQNVPGGETVQYDGVSLIDDDNGNLADGTPNAAEYNEAFQHHEIEGTPLVPDSAECVPPVAPTVTLSSQLLSASSGLWQVHVTWPSVAGTVQYVIYRNDTGPTGSYVAVGTILPPATEFFDDNVTDGVTYNYRVGVFDTAGCVSINDNSAPIAISSLVNLALDSFAIDDSGPQANFNGIAEPGETLTLSASVANTSGTLAPAVIATLTSTFPGVTIIDGSATVGDLAGGATLPTQAPHFSVRLDASIACGATIPFTVELESPAGCSVAGFTIDTGRVGPFIPAWTDDIEADLGWTRVAPPAGPTAGAGLWERGDPNPTMGGSQLGDDHTADPGIFAWVTGNDPDPAPGNDDVDDGCTTVLSPSIDLGGQTGLTLQYWRFFTIINSNEDSLAFEISNDDGANWLPLETLTAPTAGWEQASIPLDPILGGPANRVRVRATACDIGNRTRIEAMLDDVRFGRTTMVCEAPAARPRLRVAATAVADGTAFGGAGNADGIIDPSETIRVPVDLANFGNAAATAIAGTVAITSAPAGVTLTDSTAPWADLAVAAVGTSAGAPPHFELTLDPGVPCAGEIVLALHVSYQGPEGSYYIDEEITLPIGADVETTIFADDFETSDNGFTHGASCANPGCDDWMRLPMSGVSPNDPPAAHGGLRVWANDVGGDVGGTPYDGDYRANTTNWLDSPSIDCSGRTGVKLGFWRWLTIEGSTFDFARIYVNGTQIWVNPGDPAPYVDTAWTYVEYDISAMADNNPSVIIRFELQSDGGLELGGWTIDDLKVFTRDRVCIGAPCSSPAVPGPVGNFLRPTGTNYDQSSVEFDWVGASLPANETFTLRRATMLRPVADWATITPPSFLATSFRDTAAPNALYFYTLVRENCAGVLGPDTP